MMKLMNVAVALLLLAGCSVEDKKKKKPDFDTNETGNKGDDSEGKPSGNPDNENDVSNTDTSVGEKIPFTSGSWNSNLQGSLNIENVRVMSYEDFDAKGDDDPITEADLSEQSELLVTDENEGYYVEICFDKPRAEDEVEETFHMLDDEKLFITTDEMRVREMLHIYFDESLNVGLRGFRRSDKCVYTQIEFENLESGTSTMLLRVRDRMACDEHYRENGREDSQLGLLCNSAFDDFKDRFDAQFDTVITLDVKRI